ncbi:Low-density lipoprotein receptor class A domain-containing protein 3 [Holothuria leucospilota]|uniref:Low-density lipoprotein receptor class A domain-containing protein 3 n=1 Tax=Holothuria leucospilota TaxID=206669 RepID=A0A9Q1HJM1_HOLLE|nr:Low-density lipoprotein receptor class A domain-containing protein 3 [Holothuria leucospilota]
MGRFWTTSFRLLISSYAFLDDFDSCGPSEFKCYHGECIPGSWQCDGTPDCYEGDDELWCDGTRKISNSIDIWSAALCKIFWQVSLPAPKYNIDTWFIKAVYKARYSIDI